MKYLDEFRSPEAVRTLLEKINGIGGSFTFMEVCGTHTVAISKAGLRPLLSPVVDLVSGPGCPVCVTDDRDIDRIIAMSYMPGVTVATFGDMMKVPGTKESLEEAATLGARVKVVYSPLEALDIAKAEQDRDVVFLGVGFETTAPAVAATILQAREKGLVNLYVLSLHKLVPPALRTLVEMPDFHVDGFILPGHVSTIIGSEAYSFLPSEFGIPCVVTGFEAPDILQAIYRLMKMREEGPAIEIEYSRVVRPQGNPKALAVMDEVFERGPARWRGLFEIPESGLVLREDFSDFDAGNWRVHVTEAEGQKGCRCGDILCGKIKPMECPLFAKKCTPESPVGPCMVSSEGTCASYYHYDQTRD